MTEFRLASRREDELVCEADSFADELTSEFTPAQPAFTPAPARSPPAPGPGAARPAYLCPAAQRGQPEPATFLADPVLPTFLDPQGAVSPPLPQRTTNPLFLQGRDAAATGTAPAATPTSNPASAPASSPPPKLASTPPVGDAPVPKGARTDEPDKSGKTDGAEPSETDETAKDDAKGDAAKKNAKTKPEDAEEKDAGGGEKGGKLATKEKGKAGAAKSRKAGKDGAGEDADETVALPPIDTASPPMGRAPVRHTLSGEAFRAAAPPAFRVQPKAGGKPEPPSPQRAEAVALFREAMAQAAKLHAGFLAAMDQAAASVQATDASLASQAQGDLDRGFTMLRAGLDQARLELDMRADAADAFIELRRRRTNGAIGGLAKSAVGTLGKLKKDADATFKAHDGDRAKVSEYAQNELDAVTSAGTDAANAVRGLDESKETDFPLDGEPLDAAVNEAVGLRIPKRSKERAKTYEEESEAQGTLLSGIFKGMNDALATQFPLIKKAMDDTAKSSEESIGKSRVAARKQLAKGAREMHRAVSRARASGHAALVEQHNTLRRQMVGAHRDRALRENTMAQQRAARGAAAALNAAKAQQAGADGLGEALAKEAARPPDDFAKVMSASARGLLRQGLKSGPEQRDRIERSVRTGEDDARAQSQALGGRLAASANDSAGQLHTASMSAGKGIDEQVKAGVKPFDEIPGQITAALKATLPTTMKGYEGLNEGTDEKPGAGKMIATANKSIPKTIAGEGGGGNTPTPTPAPAPAGGKSKGPKEKPGEFRDRAWDIADMPLEEEGITALVATANADIPSRIDTKAGNLYDALQATSTNVESVMVHLRGLTKLQGRALSAVYKEESNGKDLASHLKSELNKFFSAEYTNEQNIAAALAYLAGDTVKAAKHELKAAVYLWNDTGRSEKVLRALTPEELDKLNQAHPDVMADVSGDLDESEKQIFDSLKQIKPVAHLEGDALTKQLEANYKLLGVANAHALKRDIDQSLKTKGEEGGDKAADTVSTAYETAGSDAIAGGDGAYEDRDEAEARRSAVWKETNTSFETVAKKLPDGSDNVQADDGSKLGAIARYAAAARTRTEFVPDDGPHGGHYETVKKGLDPRQARLIDDIVNTGPNSEETAASTIEFETNRKEGKPREDRLRKALLGDDLMGAREGESDKDREKRLKERRDPNDNLVGDEARVKARKENVLRKVAERRAEGQKSADGTPVPPMSPEDVQKQITEQLDARFAGDKTGAEYTKSMITSPTFEPDPEKAFDFALAHDERNKETLKATTERMNRDQIKRSVEKWDNAHPGESLYSRLGLYKKGGAKLEGDAKNETEIAFRGKPRNDKEKALIAVMAVEQQRRDSTAVGRGMASNDYDRMVAKQKKVLDYMGIARDQIDETGDIKTEGPDGKEIRGNFNEEGQLELKGDQRRDFESAMRFSHMKAESYKQAVDRISQGIVMALIVAAAVITTFVTFGGAAAIWGPILITAAAGFAGMAMTAAIRGDRYTSAEIQRDFVMTLVSAATAGLGAKLGAAAKGAGAAAKGAAAVGKGAETAAKAASATQKLATGAAGAGTKQGMSFGAKAMQFGKDVVVGGTTNSINSFAAAAMDPENRRQGKSLSKGIDGGVKGFLSGSLGAAVTKPMSALGRPLGKGAERMAGNVGSGFTQRLAEARIGQAMGDPHQSWAESIEGAKEGIAQDAIQSFGEHHAENAAARRAARKAQATARAGSPARPSGEAPHLEGPAQPAKRVPDDDGVARAQAVKEAIPPEVRPIADQAAAQTRPPAANDNGPAEPARRAVGDADDGLRMRTQRRDDDAPRLRTGGDEADPNEITQKLPKVDLSDEAPITRRETAEEREAPVSRREFAEVPEPPIGKRGLADLNADPDPRPKPIVDTIDLTPEMLRQSRSIPENSRITATDPHSEAAAHANYHAMREQDVHREVLLAKCVDPSNERYGQYMVIQGDPDSVRRPPPGWVTERHSHPLQFEVATAARLVTSLPSGEGADFGVLRREVDMLSGLVNSAQGIKRESVIDVRLGDQLVETHFSITRNGDAYEYRVSFRPPHDGVDKLGPFYSLADYEATATKLTGQKWGTGRQERMYTADAAGTVSASPPRAVHGEAVTPSMRKDLDFIAGRMALAGEFEGQAAGTRPRGDLDPKLGRAATLSDAHERVKRMGLVGEPDSMIRLHNILNDDNIPMATRAMISDVALAATRNHLLDTGQLAPGEPLVMLFHGATPERTQSLVKEGIDMTRRPGGADDDFGEGLYFTRSFETALEYRNRRGGGREGDPPGGVVPYLLRGRDVVNAVDVSSTGRRRAEWEAFATANAQTLLAGRDKTYASPVVRKIMLGEPIRFSDFGPELLNNRGKLFNDFLGSIGARPDVIFGDLGGPLTNGIQLRHVTDQVVIRSQDVADIMNRQHVRPGTSDADILRTGGSLGGDDGLRMRTAGPKAQASTTPPAPGTKPAAADEGPKAIVLAPIEHLDAQQLKNRVDNAFDAMAPGPQPRRSSNMSEEGVSLKDPAVAAAEQARRADKVANVLAEVAARRGPEAAARLAELMIIGGEPMARALRAETEGGMARALDALPKTLAKPLNLTPTQRDELITLMLDRAAREGPNEPPHLRESRVRRQVDRWEKNGLSPGDTQKFGAAALDLRGEGRQGFATPARRGQDAEDFKLRPNVDAALEAQGGSIWGVQTLRDILATTRRGWLVRFAHEGMLARGDAVPPLIERWYAYLDSVKPPAKVTAAGFENAVRGHMKRVHRAAFSELEAAFALGGKRPHRAFSTKPPLDQRLDILKCAIDPVTGQNNPTVGGTDLIGYRRADDKVVVGDDKAWTRSDDNRGVVDEVKAYFPSKEQAKKNPRAGLIQNLADDAQAMGKIFAKQQAQGLTVDPKHLGIPDRLEAASKALEKAFPKGLVLTKATAPKVRKILRAHGIELIVTSMAGRDMTSVSDRLRKAGVIFRRGPIIFPEPEDEE